MGRLVRTDTYIDAQLIGTSATDWHGSIFNNEGGAILADDVVN